MKSTISILLLAAVFAAPLAFAFAATKDTSNYKAGTVYKNTSSYGSSYSGYNSYYSYYPSYSYSSYYPSTYSTSYSTCAQLYYCSNPGANYYASNYQYSRYSPGWSRSSQIYNYRPLPNTTPARHTTGLDPNSQLYTTPTPAAASNNNSGSVGWDPNSQLYTVPTPRAATNNNSGSTGWDADRQVLHYSSSSSRNNSHGSSGWDEDSQSYKYSKSRTSSSSRSTRSTPAYSYCDQILPGSQLDDGSCGR